MLGAWLLGSGPCTLIILISTFQHFDGGFCWFWQDIMVNEGTFHLKVLNGGKTSLVPYFNINFPFRLCGCRLVLASLGCLQFIFSQQFLPLSLLPYLPAFLLPFFVTCYYLCPIRKCWGTRMGVIRAVCS